MKRPTKKKEQPEPNIPAGAPDLDPMLGDKTPAYVEWLRDNDPEEFARRYSGRRTHLGFTP
jgi:hypothetical protein